MAQTAVNSLEEVAPVVSSKPGHTIPERTSTRFASSVPVVEADLEGAPSRGQRIKASIGEVIGDSVVVICQTSGGEYRTRFPRVAIPNELVKFGQAVYLSIDFDGPFRAPHFESRAPDPMVEEEDFATISDWLNS